MNTTAKSAYAIRGKGLMIAGAHRSGTSALSRLCNLLGVDLGPDLLPPGADNPRGYWEHKAVLRLHEKALEQLGSSWDDCRALPDNWLLSPAIERCRESIREIVTRDFSRAPLWGVKDPRLCRLLPLWQDVLSTLAIPIVHVIILRDPLEVAASLEARNSFPQGKGLLLWLRHSLELERHSRGQSRVVISYADLLDDWQSVMTNVAAVLRITWPVAADSIAAEVDAFLARDLRHHVTARDVARGGGGVPALIERAFQALISLSDNDDKEAQARLDEISNELARMAVLYDPALEGLHNDRTTLAQDRKTLRARCAELEHEHDRKHARIQTLDCEAQQASARIQTLQGEAQQASGRMRELAGDVKQTRARVQALEVESSRLHSELAGARRELKGVYASKSWRFTGPIRAGQRVSFNAVRILGRRRRLFAPDNAKNDPAGHFHVDKALIVDSRLEIKGWAFHETQPLTTGAMVLYQAGGQRRVPLRLGIARADVHAVWGTDNALDSGFRGVASVDAASLKEVGIEFETAEVKALRARVHPQHRRRSLMDRYQIAHGLNRLVHGDSRYLWDRLLRRSATITDIVSLKLASVDSTGNDRAGRLCVDEALVADGRLQIAGWAFHKARQLTTGFMIFNDTLGERRVPLRVGIKRSDVHATHGEDNALLSGFRGTALLNRAPTDVRLEFEIAGMSPLGARLKLIETPDLPEPQPGGLQAALALLGREPRALAPLQARIDIIIPVYNGFEYLEPLFGSIKRSTHSPYRLIVIDDASPDDRVWPHLKALTGEHPQITLLRNKRNLGFVRTVNFAAKQVEGDFVLLNTDVEVPANWLERLMAPIQTDRTIASTTPFSNAATVCSFPTMGVDNPPLAGLEVERIDRWFRRVGPDQTPIELPTGIGFCMGVNGDAWRRVGSFDARTFGRGYGEENDWSLRAKAAGYFNVLVPNLFVHHKHGGSFDKATRDGLREKNLRKVIARHPRYPRMVEAFVSEDPAGLVRRIMTMLVACGEATRAPVLIVDHELGGGANAYRQQMVRARLAADQPILLLTARPGANMFPEDASLRCLYRAYDVSLEIEDLSALEPLFADHIQLGEIFYNDLVFFKRPVALLHVLHRLKLATDARLTAAIHDFYPLCPSFNLLNAEGTYCKLPEIETCQQCLPVNRFAANPEDTEIQGWRGAWGGLLKIADTILCFSEDSRRHVTKVYPECATKVEVRPHQLNVEFARRPRMHREGPLHVGVVGAIPYAKGSKVVADLAQYLLEADPRARVTVIGTLDHAPRTPNLSVTGPYEPQELPDLLERHGVNVCFLPSIWPETFSYVTSELMALGVPIACFDVGAPPERINGYPHGAVLAAGDGFGSIVRSLLDLASGSRVHGIVEQAQGTSD